MNFRDYAGLPDDRLDLLTGALLIARDAYPGLDFAVQKSRLDALALPLTRLGIATLPVELQARCLADHLFVAHGLHGAGDDYCDPRNSFLNEVLERRIGIPITLSVLYVEVAIRVGIRARGVGFPGHFLVRLDDDRQSVVIDPFAGGSVLARSDLTQLLERVGGKLKLCDEMLEATPVRHIIARMLMNLRGIYAARADYPRLLVVLDHLIDLLPDTSCELRDRGYLQAKLGAPRAAIADLQRYIRALPNAGDVAEVRRFVTELEARPLAAN